MMIEKIKFFWFEFRSFVLNALINIFWSFLVVVSFLGVMISLYKLFTYRFLPLVMTMILTGFKQVDRVPVVMWGWAALLIVSFVFLHQAKIRFARVNDHSRYQPFNQ